MKKIPSRFITIPPSILAVAGLTGFHDTRPVRSEKPPNILLIMVDQMQTPPEGYGPNEGAVQDLKEILGFRPLSPGNAYTDFFSGLMRLRQNAVVLKKHYTASAASVPSRSCIMTGQYPVITNVTQTDGIFKTPEDVPFLDPNGAPTIGDWFRAAGYTTHYFGKWHVSEAKPPDYLEPWGFSDWASSYPEPHGGTSSNLGVFRDVGFADDVIAFLNNVGTYNPEVPWFTVGSLVNPHDVSAWPINWQAPGNTGVVPWKDFPPPPSIPSIGAKSRMDTLVKVYNGDTITKIFQVELNPDGFLNDNSYLPPTFNESLEYKPLCQRDYALKWGLEWGATTDNNFMHSGVPKSMWSPHPFQLQGENDSLWSLSYVRFYFYCQYLADLQIRRMLQALDSNGLTDNTIVIFLSDHGDMTSAHGGMIQKWHNAYEESIRVPMVISSPLVNSNAQEIREIMQPTSSIDLAPTLLALAGFTQEELRGTMMDMHGPSAVSPFPGADLSSYINGTATGPIIGPDGNPRAGVLFIGDDMISELGENPGQVKTDAYELFLERVDSVIDLGYPLAAGTVCQPNNSRAFCTGDWKLVKYADPQDMEEDQWELYCLANDPIEEINLVDYATGEVRTDVSVPGMTMEELIAKNDYLRNQLAIATGLAEPAPPPSKLNLFQNQPNPFTSQTTIPFYLPEGGQVRLTLLDLAGKEVQVIADQSLKAGHHTCSFSGTQLPAGVYLVRLSVKSQQVVKKMILMK